MIEDESMLARLQLIDPVLRHPRWSVLLADPDDGVRLGDMELGQLLTQVKHTMNKHTLAICDLQTVFVGFSKGLHSLHLKIVGLKKDSFKYAVVSEVTLTIMRLGHCP